MFRAIFKSIPTRSYSTPAGIELKKTIAPYRPAAELNRVKLMGTIEHKVHRFKHGPLKMYLKTQNEDASYFVHKVSIANEKLLSIVGNQLNKGMRIFVGGRLKTDSSFIEAKRWNDVEIMATEIYLLDPNPNEEQKDITPSQMDMNSVEILANIGSNVLSGSNFCSFDLTTHYKSKSVDNTGYDRHRVVVYHNDDMYLHSLKLEKNDRVYVKGFIKYIDKLYPDVKSRTNGFLTPTNIVRLKKIDYIKEKTVY